MRLNGCASILSVVLFLSVLALYQAVPVVRSDQIDSALAILDDSGKVAAFQLPLIRKEAPERREAVVKNARKVTRAVYSATLTTDEEIAWGVPINLGSSTGIIVTVDSGSSDLYVSGPLCTSSSLGCTTGSAYVESGSFGDIPCPSTICSESTQTACHSLGGNQVCAVTTCYGAGGLSGVVSTDLFGMNGIPNKATVTFGNLFDASGDQCTYPGEVFTPQWAGIMGVAFGSIAEMPGFNATALDKLIAANNLTNAFSLCVLPTNAFMSIGSDYSCNTDFVYTTIVNDAYYQVTITDMGTDGTSFGLTQAQLNQVVANAPTIVDSGTTELILNSASSSALNSALNKLCSDGAGLVGYCGILANETIFAGFCYAMQTSDIQAYPSVYVTIGGATITLQGSDWVLPGRGCPSGYYASGINWFSNAPTILGDTFMRTQHVVFDKKNNRIGFGPTSTCNLPAATCSRKLSTILTSCLSLFADLLFCWQPTLRLRLAATAAVVARATQLPACPPL